MCFSTPKNEEEEPEARRIRIRMRKRERGRESEEDADKGDIRCDDRMMTPKKLYHCTCSVYLLNDM